MNIPAVLRHLLWRAVLALTGGLTVSGALPRGGCVVVANHSSHADTAALLAATDARHAPRVAAAADYWFAAGWRTTISRSLAAAFPVRRTGGGSVDIACAVSMLRSGHAVIVYPEGTRSSGPPAAFHGGAFRLAAAAGVPVVPAGIAGTGELLPKNGRLRRHPVAVRFGAPLPIDGGTAPAEAARVEVAQLAAAPAPVKDSRWRLRVERIALSRLGVAAVAAWAVAEATVWPFVPELAVFALVAAAPRAGLKLVPTAVLASMLGGLAMLTLGAHGIAPAAPLITEPMRVEVRQQTTAEGPAAVRHQPLSGIPFKVYAAEAGRAGVEPLPFLGSALLARGLRIALIGVGCVVLGFVLQRVHHLYPLVVLGGTAGFGVGLALVVLAWT